MPRYHSNEFVIYATASDGRTKSILGDRDEVLDFVVNQLLPIYNANWRSPGAPTLTQDAFLNSISVPKSSIECAQDELGNVQLHLDSGDLFNDHGVSVTLDRTGRPRFVGVE